MGSGRQQSYVLQYLPFVVEANFTLRGSASNAHRKLCKTIDSFLLSLYNSQVADNQGAPHETAIRLSNLTQGSLYHDGGRIDLEHVNGVGGGNVGGSVQLTLRLYRQATRVTGQNRMVVSEALLRAFNSNIGELSKPFLDQCIRCSQRMLMRGYSGSGQRAPTPRIALSANALLELLYGAYFCIYNGLQSQGSQGCSNSPNVVFLYVALLDLLEIAIAGHVYY
jgi:hypothetical protein